MTENGSELGLSALESYPSSTCCCRSITLAPVAFALDTWGAFSPIFTRKRAAGPNKPQHSCCALFQCIRYRLYLYQHAFFFFFLLKASLFISVSSYFFVCLFVFRNKNVSHISSWRPVKMQTWVQAGGPAW